MVPSKQIVFIIGCDRSGTHWLARILTRRFGFHTTMEVDPLYSHVKAVANNPRMWKERGQKIWAEYVKHFRKAGGRPYADKSHPLLWHAEKAAKKFPHVKFVATRRSMLASVSSMLDHGGVPAAVAQWRRYPLPVMRFGLIRALSAVYGKMAMEQKLALYWIAHECRLELFRQRFPKRLHIVNYDELIRNNKVEFSKLTAYLGWPNIRDFSGAIHTNCLDKWKDKLTVRQMENLSGMEKYRDAIWGAMCKQF